MSPNLIWHWAKQVYTLSPSHLSPGVPKLYPLVPPTPSQFSLLTAVGNLVIFGLVKIMFLISWLLKSFCETRQFMMVLIMVLGEQMPWKPQRQHRAMKNSNCDLPIENLPDVSDIPVLGLFTKGWYWLRGGEIPNGEKAPPQTWDPESSATENLEQLSWAVAAPCQCSSPVSPELVTELPLCSSHWVFLPSMVSEHLSCYCWIFAMSLLFLSSPCCERVFPHPFPTLCRDITTT